MNNEDLTKEELHLICEALLEYWGYILTNSPRFTKALRTKIKCIKNTVDRVHKMRDSISTDTTYVQESNALQVRVD